MTDSWLDLLTDADRAELKRGHILVDYQPTDTLCLALAREQRKVVRMRNILIAASFGLLAAFSPAWGAALLLFVSDVFLSLPWLFLLITVRAVLPLNVSPLTSVLITFLILGLLGWAAAARVLESAGAGLLVLCTNTLHRVAPAVQAPAKGATKATGTQATTAADTARLTASTTN